MKTTVRPCPAGCGRLLGRGGLVLHLLSKHPEYQLRPPPPPAPEPKWTPKATWPIGMTLATPRGLR